ncbi:hypothetical protein K502DRAFT_324233 [Neoconidiobolus thromboides FSU 785]|nr:hypothetical protein K502DRAFT_324233 [Neoconidiobolus thromboides FSU 785]
MSYPGASNKYNNPAQVSTNAYGQPIIDPLAYQYGPCPTGGLHDIRYHYKTYQLLLAFLILPVFCFKSKNIVCKKCNKVLGST